ncbi:MAG: preprotein translocase subunit SecE [Gammaproteobacteria bacterium]|nr:preprotein translocase subunit SecE [Gammaproteobacteria bacterium]
MSESKNIIKRHSNIPLTMLSLVMLMIGIVMFYYFSEIRLFYRVLGMLVVIGMSIIILYQTDFGKTAYSYIIDSKVELKKVTWPTKQETTQTALGVIVIVVIIGLILWLLDMLFAWAIGNLYGIR